MDISVGLRNFARGLILLIYNMLLYILNFNFNVFNLMLLRKVWIEIDSQIFNSFLCSVSISSIKILVQSCVLMIMVLLSYRWKKDDLMQHFMSFMYKRKKKWTNYWTLRYTKGLLKRCVWNGTIKGDFLLSSSQIGLKE